MDVDGDSDTPAGRHGFSRTIRDGVRLVDCVALSTIPFLLLVVFALPQSIRLSYVFDYTDPTLVTSYTAHFVHLRAEHLVTNLVGYVLLAGVGYLVAVLTGNRRLFGIVSTSYLLAFPVVLSALNLAIPRDAVTYGFSGIVMAFAGFLPLLLCIYATDCLAIPAGVRHAPGVFFGALAIISLTALPTNRTTIGIAIASVLASLGYMFSGVQSWRATENDPSRSTRHSGWIELFVLGVALTVAYPVIGFRLTASSGPTVPNLYAHLLGYCLAFITPYIGLELGILAPVESTTPSMN